MVNTPINYSSYAYFKTPLLTYNDSLGENVAHIEMYFCKISYVLKNVAFLLLLIP
jgi:hypothetical protein